MRSQVARDQQTITIATALAIVVAGVLVGGVLLILANVIGDISDGANTVLAYVTAVIAVTSALAYLIRNRRT